jgi:hypothetical protein
MSAGEGATFAKKCNLRLVIERHHLHFSITFLRERKRRRKKEIFD